MQKMLFFFSPFCGEQSQHTWIILSDGDEVKQAFTRQQLCNHGKKAVSHLSASLSTSPGSFYTSAADLEVKRDLLRTHGQRLTTMNFPELGYLFWRRDHVGRVEEEDVNFATQPRQKALHLWEKIKMKSKTALRYWSFFRFKMTWRVFTRSVMTGCSATPLQEAVFAVHWAAAVFTSVQLKEKH